MINLDTVAEAISGAYKPAVDPRTPCAKHMAREAAKRAIGSLRELPSDMFDSNHEQLLWTRVIDQIGKAIALGVF